MLRRTLGTMIAMTIAAVATASPARVVDSSLLRPFMNAPAVFDAEAIKDVIAHTDHEADKRPTTIVGRVQTNVTAAAHADGQSYTGKIELHSVLGGGVHDAGTIVVAAGAACDPSWLPTFGGRVGLNGGVYVLMVFDDGSGGGPALYAGGDFTTAGGATADYIARWDGLSWSPLGKGMNGGVGALTVFDDGSGGGPALYAGGHFTSAGSAPANYVARWDGASWSSLGSGMNDRVNALTVFDDGSGGGPALYAGGDFTTAGGARSNRIARWDGTSWSPLGSGMDDWVRAMTVFDDGSGGGPALVVGGGFQVSTAGDSFLAKWGGCAPDPAACDSDLNGDDIVDFTDLILLIAAWGSCNGCPEDLTGDGVVGIEDLFVLLAAWGPCP